MAGSVGAKHSPLNDVRTLRDLVRRYHLGFPIIKELLQNADDAGATTLDIGWVPGLTRSRHPLLRGPAIFVRNNGPFTETNAWSIQHIGVSDKGGQQSAIGKFGYGLKSVFHLCEAFAFLWSTQTPDDTNGFPLDDGTLFNPWKGDDGKNYHPEWDGFSVDDTNEIADVVQLVGASESLSSEPWFCLWIPLRRQEHLNGVEPISTHRYGDEATPPKFLAEDLPLLAEELTKSLAMLRSIERVRVWLPTVGSQESLALQVQLEPGAQRRRFDGEPLEPGYLPLSGRVTISGSDLTTSDAGFAGVETFLAEPRFAEFQKRRAWPKEALHTQAPSRLRLAA